jgi:DNA (cytosine-5)-methyltransferase 1
LNVLSLFAGIGGFDLGLERAGMRVVGQCELDPFCQKVLAKHWPDIPCYPDVRELTKEVLDADGITDIGLICGGFPCTQTSVAAAIHGNRKGLNGKDSGLWFHLLRAIEQVQPRWAIIENPGGVLEWENEIQGGLEGAGYRVSRLVFEAADFGLPHIRRRFFYVANRDGKRLAVARPARPSKTEWFQRLAANGGTWLSDTPGTGGVFNGIPDRTHRLKALGNAVVPAVVEQIGKFIMQADNEQIRTQS